MKAPLSKSGVLLITAPWVQIPPSPPFIQPLIRRVGRDGGRWFYRAQVAESVLQKKRCRFAERCPSWPKEHDWKSCVLLITAPWVRTPLSPPLPSFCFDGTRRPVHDARRTERPRSPHPADSNPTFRDMSYLVLARKYRPQTFAEVIEQGHITRTLSNALSAGRVAHAILFAGPRGTGKTTIARILAKALNCQAGPAAAPCNQCRSCSDITAGRAVDVYEIDGASNNSVDQVRELRENIKYMPAHSPLQNLHHRRSAHAQHRRRSTPC